MPPTSGAPDRSRRVGPTRSTLFRGLPGTVVALGVVSFLTDVSSEMIYPLLPIFLTTVLAAGPEVLGFIEGVAESTAALVKLASGLWTDRLRRRKPLVASGYGLAGMARPLVGLATAWPAVLGLRFADRIGKGLRTSPRDALIADAVPPPRRGEAYGLQRALDHAGAVTGPLVAAALVGWLALPLPTVFLLSAVPAALVMVVVVGCVHEPKRRGEGSPDTSRPPHWRDLDRRFWWVVGALGVFTLGNSTDAFLLLRLSSAGLSATGVALLWSLFHVVKTAATFAGGRASDRLGRRGMVIAGWAVYAAVYLAFAVVTSLTSVVATFLAYGLYFGLTEPVEKAWIADLAPVHLRGTAFGFYHGVVGLAALPASLVFGALWKRFGSPAAFLSGAALAGAATLLLLLAPRRAQT
jgi:MFS family permease